MPESKRIINNFAFIFLIFSLTCFLFGEIKSWAGGRAHQISGELFASAVVSKDVYITAGDRGVIYLSKDRGTTWELVKSPTKKALASICFSDPGHGWIVGQSGVILHSADGGQTWQAQSSGVDKYLLDVDFIDSKKGFAVGADAAIVMTTDSGRTWYRSSFKLPQQNLEEEFNFFAVEMMDKKNICFAGDGGRIFRSSNGGLTWTEAKSPLYDQELMEGKILYAMAYDSGFLYAVGIDGILIYSRDQGHTWEEIDTGFTGPELYCLDIIDGVGLAAGSGGHIIRTKDGGFSWQIVAVPEKTTRFWLSGLDLNKTDSGNIYGLIVGQNGTAGQVVNNEIRW